jgi:hypothetical protein
MTKFLQKDRILNIATALIVIGLIVGLYYFVARPYQLTLGATPAEIQRSMPGDELDPDPDFLATRAITIRGTPEEIWPWLIQMSYNRAGFYGYDILENIGSERGMQSAAEIIPEFQHFQVGDEVPISAIYSIKFYAIEPNQYLIWSSSEGAAPGGFTWALVPIDDTQTRLISRIRWSYHLTDPGAVAMAVFTDLSDHLAVRKILQGIKGRVEGQIEPMWVANLEFTVFLMALGLYLAALIFLWVRPLNLKRFLIGSGTGIVWLIIWYAPISAWGMLVLIGLSFGCVWLIARNNETRCI